MEREYVCVCVHKYMCFDESSYVFVCETHIIPYRSSRNQQMQTWIGRDTKHETKEKQICLLKDLINKLK